LTPPFDAFVADTGAIVRTGKTACYLPARDEIQMPDRTLFRSTEGFCATLAHELVHWTGAPHRLDRQLTTRFGSRAYAAEELVAELGAAFILASLSLAPEPHTNHAAYMAGWLPLVRDDPRALVTAASLASKATQFLAQPASPTKANTVQEVPKLGYVSVPASVIGGAARATIVSLSARRARAPRMIATSLRSALGTSVPTEHARPSVVKCPGPHPA